MLKKIVIFIVTVALLLGCRQMYLYMDHVNDIRRQRDYDTGYRRGQRAAQAGLPGDANPYAGNKYTILEAVGWADGYVEEKSQ